ncbi:tripartite tricarboxylate transporter TctB family protein [Haladaptatus caseinilyticus]|uniref:tripartite tricarboxylate transporter TctB family protein n=1 Tax=Haladaptatus caseinilyticus TaxID=2993314 RepID=UPI00224AF13E|nr:tripartite tricarboxylate transporter TctB family protein [Haladaptatus caseinilyticus]
MSNEENTKIIERNPVTPIVDVIQAIDGEPVFFWLLIGTAGYMFVAAGDFSASARLFPRLTAGTILIAGVLKLVVTHLGIGLKRSEKVVLSGGHSESESDEEISIESMVVLGLLIGGYVLGGFVVGLFWMTPLFVFLYLLYNKQPLWKVIALTAIMTSVAYGFMIIMNLDLMTGGF